MPNTVEEITRALKLKADRRNSGLSAKVGQKKYALPFEVASLHSDEYVFIQVLPSAGIFKVTDEGLTEVSSDSEAKQAQLSFRKTRKASPAKTTNVALPNELAQALSKIPAGYRLGFDASGAPRLVKTRNRGKN